MGGLGRDIGRESGKPRSRQRVRQHTLTKARLPKMAAERGGYEEVL